MARSTRKAAVFWPVLAGVLLLDVTTKSLAVLYLTPQYLPHEVFGNAVQLTLAYNRGASFGIEVGPYSRVVFIGLALIALVILGRLFRAAAPTDRVRAAALALICGGALGNVLDRVRSERGVVDFIDIGFGGARFYTFNIADAAITTGAIMLGWILWREDHRPALAPAVTDSAGAS
ncbi:MAG: signal peptidase II [Gemmatimonadaceae bacterium]